MNEFVTQFFFLGLIIAHVSFYLYHLRQYYRIHKRNFSFLNQFPFELFHATSVDIFTGSLLLFFSTFSSMMFFIYKTSTYNRFFNAIFLFLLTMIALSSFILFLIKPLKIEIFIFNSTLLLTMTLAFYGWSSFVFAQVAYSQQLPATVWISSLFFLITTLLVFNPKLKHWSQLEQVGNNEKPLYQRPKLFILALTQWFVLFGLIVYAILLQMVSFI